MGCGGSTSQTTVNSIPQWVEQAGKDSYGKAVSFYNQGYKPYTGERNAAFTPGQTSAIAQTRAYAPPDVTGKAMGLVDQATAPISSERIVDQGGRLGATKDYVNPYVEGALNPALDQIWRSYNTQRKGIDSAAIGAHAFGDARHGIMENGLGRDTTKAVADTTYGAYKGAFDAAMGQRSDDLNRFLATDAGNRSTAMAGASALPAIGAADQNAFLARMSALLGVGGMEQQQNQNILDAGYGSYQAGEQDKYDRMAALVSVLGQTPYTRTSTTTGTSSPGIGGIAGGIGSILGAFV